MGAPLLGMPRVMLSPTGKLAFNVQGPSSTPTGSGGYSPMAPPIGRNIIGVRSGTAPSGSSFSGGPAVRWGMEMLTGPREIASAPRLGSPVAITSSNATTSSDPTVVTTCGSNALGNPNAAVFNLEATSNPTAAQPQNEVVADFLPGQGTSGADLVVEGANDFRGVPDFLNNFTPTFAGVAGYYVGNGCTPVFEGALPPLPGIFSESVPTQGDPIVATNQTNNNVYYSTLAFSRLSTNVTSTTTAVGLFYSTAANLLACPSGTHSETQSATCWNNSSTSAGILVNALPGGLQGPLEIDKPSMAVDQRVSGTGVAGGAGAGDVYVTGTLFDLFDNFSSIFLVACTSNLSACSDPVYVSDDPNSQAAAVQVDPYGNISVVYVNYTFNGSGVLTGGQIRYVACVPGGAPMNPSCMPAQTVAADANILPQNGPMAANDFRVNSIPTQVPVENSSTGAIQSFIAWADCNYTPLGEAVCPSVGINGATATTVSSGGALVSTPSWSADGFLTGLGFQDVYMPALAVDRNQGIVNLILYRNGPDTAVADGAPATVTLAYRHRGQIAASQIPAGSTTLTKPLYVVNAVLFEPALDLVLGDSFFGDYIGAAARGASLNGTGASGSSKMYVGYTYNLRQTQAGASGPLVGNQDNFLNLVTY
jgi:hypothetical protein